MNDCAHEWHKKQQGFFSRLVCKHCGVGKGEAERKTEARKRHEQHKQGWGYLESAEAAAKVGDTNRAVLMAIRYLKLLHGKPTDEPQTLFESLLDEPATTGDDQ